MKVALLGEVWSIDAELQTRNLSTRFVSDRSRRRVDPLHWDARSSVPTGTARDAHRRRAMPSRTGDRDRAPPRRPTRTRLGIARTRGPRTATRKESAGTDGPPKKGS